MQLMFSAVIGAWTTSVILSEPTVNLDRVIFRVCGRLASSIVRVALCRPYNSVEGYRVYVKKQQNKPFT